MIPSYQYTTVYNVLAMVCPGYDGGGPIGGGCILQPGGETKLGVGGRIPPGATGHGTCPSTAQQQQKMYVTKTMIAMHTINDFF